MTALDLGGVGRPVDPKLIQAVECAFNAVSFTKVPFVPAPRIFLESNRRGSAKSPSGQRKATIKLQLIDRDGFRCAYCAREFVDLDDATLDHVIPNRIVGHWQPWNLVLACEPCNNLKGDHIPLALMPGLCALLVMSHRFPRKSVQSAPQAPRWRAAKLEKVQRRARKRRQRFANQMEALTGTPFRLALEPAPVRKALPAGPDGPR